MGRYSYVLVGTERAFAETFGSTCHGAGRRLSRHKAKELARSRNVAKELEARGILVRAASRATVFLTSLFHVSFPRFLFTSFCFFHASLSSSISRSSLRRRQPVTMAPSARTGNT